MRNLRRLLWLCLVSAGVGAIRFAYAAEPAPTPSGQTNSAAIAATSSAGVMDANSEQRARELLQKLTSGPTPSVPAQPAPTVSAAPPSDDKGREAARQKALTEARQVGAAQPGNVAAPSSAEVDLQREREINRIESEIEAARKRREAANPQTATVPPAATAQPTVTPVTDAQGLAILKGQTASPSPSTQKAPAASTSASSVSKATPPAVGAAPVAPGEAVAGPDGATLTSETEQRARDLLHQNERIRFISTETPRPQLTSPVGARLPGAEGTGLSGVKSPTTAPVAAAVITPQPAKTEPAKVAAPAAVSATQVPASSAPAGYGLSTSEEERARELLHQLTGSPAAATPEPVRNTGVIPPPAPALELSPAPGAAPATPAAPEAAPKSSAVTPPAAVNEKPVAVAPPTEAAPATATPAVPTPPPAVTEPTPAPAGLPAATATATAANPQDEAARDVVRQAVANLRASPSAAVPSEPTAAAPTAAVAAAPTAVSQANNLTAPPTPKTEVTAPAASVEPVTQATPVTPNASASATPSNGLSPDAEAKARELVARQVAEFRGSPAVAAGTAPTAAVPGSTGATSPDELKATRELIKQQEKEGKKRRAEEKRLEEQAKKQAAKLDKEGTAKAREEARHQLEAEAKARQSGQPSPTAVNGTAANAAATPFNVGTGTKRQRLDRLTDAYTHDQISAEEYHRLRAQIIAEPSDEK